MMPAFDSRHRRAADAAHASAGMALTSAAVCRFFRACWLASPRRAAMPHACRRRLTPLLPPTLRRVFDAAPPHFCAMLIAVCRCHAVSFHASAQRHEHVLIRARCCARAVAAAPVFCHANATRQTASCRYATRCARANRYAAPAFDARYAAAPAPMHRAVADARC